MDTELCYGSDLAVLAHVNPREQRDTVNGRNRIRAFEYGLCPDCNGLFKLRKGLLPPHTPGANRGVGIIA